MGTGCRGNGKLQGSCYLQDTSAAAGMGTRESLYALSIIQALALPVAGDTECSP